MVQLSCDIPAGLGWRGVDSDRLIRTSAEERQLITVEERCNLSVWVELIRIRLQLRKDLSTIILR